MIPEQGAHPPTSKPQLLCLLVALPSALASEAPRSCFQGSRSRFSHKKYVLGKCSECGLKEEGRILPSLLQAGADSRGVESAGFCKEWYGFSRCALVLCPNIHGALCAGAGPGLSPTMESCEGGEYRGPWDDSKLNRHVDFVQ